ncbi:MAG: hypothetical protein ACI9YH_003208 [Colwellia sp.]|jgi:hypothetical protein
MFISQNLNRLVPLGYLTKEQTIRASKLDVKVGDLELLTDG